MPAVRVCYTIHISARSTAGTNRPIARPVPTRPSVIQYTQGSVASARRTGLSLLYNTHKGHQCPQYGSKSVIQYRQGSATSPRSTGLSLLYNAYKGHECLQYRSKSVI